MSDAPRRYNVVFAPAARRQFDRLPRQAQAQVAPVIEALADNPRPHNATALHGNLRGYLRVRSGDYRVVYAVEDDVLQVLVVTVANRREVYQ